MFDVGSVLIPYHIFLVFALGSSAIVGAVIRSAVKKKNPLAPDLYTEFIGIFILLVAYVVLVARNG
jgi:hypothetical protein